MPQTKYTYSIATHTLNGAVDGGQLKKNVADSAITIAVDYINTSGDILEVYMKDIMPDDVEAASASLAAVVAAHDGVSATPPPETFAPTFENTMGVFPKWKGSLLIATAGATNIFDRLIATEKQLRGGWYVLLDDKAKVGDYIEESVVDKDDVLGLFATYGLTVGVGVLELKKYVETEYVTPLSAGTKQEFKVDSTFLITAGLYLRTLYESTGPDDVQIGVTPLAYE